jgi:glycosyltransferase involved in cell wall biosynthesis
MRRRVSNVNAGAVLLLAPSIGFGGGIERVADVVERTWPTRCLRVNLYRRGREVNATGNRARQVQFGVQAMTVALRYKPELIFCLHAGLLPVAVAAAQASGGTLVLWALGDEVWLPPSRPRLALWRQVDAVFAISTFTRDRVLANTRLDPLRVHTMHLPVAPLFEGPQPSGLRSTEPQILSVGRVSRQSRYKGYYEIAACLPFVRTAVPGARWQIVGDGDDTASLLSYCRSLGLDDKAVTLTSGLTDIDVAAAYHRATVFALPSVVRINERRAEGEGFGLVYAEAGMFAVPSIASTEGGGALDFVENGKTGLTVRPGDQQGLGSAIVQVLTNSQLRDKLGRAAQAKAVRRHTFAAFEAEFREKIGGLTPLRTRTAALRRSA